MQNYSFTDILGPVMIGPSSSHTAGAARLGLIAKNINGKSFKKVDFVLHGSFAETYKGHGTDKALVAGILGYPPHDIRIKNSLAIAEELGYEINFIKEDLGYFHPNTVKVVFYNDDETVNEIIGSSLGGGSVKIKSINGFKVSFTGEYPTIIINHIDKKGVLSIITTVLATSGINIASMEVSRLSKHKATSIIIETDNEINEGVAAILNAIPDVQSVKIIQGMEGV